MSDHPSPVGEDGQEQPESQQNLPEESQLRPLPEDNSRGAVLCRDLDPFHELRSALTKLGFERDEYAGIPVPLTGIPLTVSPKFGFSKAFEEINRITMEAEIAKEGPPDPAEKALKIRNIFYSNKLRSDIMLVEFPDGKIRGRIRPAVHAASEMIATLFASDVWGIDQEQKALQTLGGMIKHRQFKQYLLTGMFIESSPRSGIPYVFRRLRPTLALAALRKGQEEAPATILCALCMHPIAYYSGSWAGAMCPTDDVIAHLALMRGDEHMFWRRCNQHEPHRPQAGI